VCALSRSTGPKLNALDTATLRNLASTVADADEQVVVVEEGRAFCAGADLEEAGEDGEDIDAYQDVTRVVRRHPGVVVRKLHGHVVGGGLELALAFDLRYAAAGHDVPAPGGHPRRGGVERRDAALLPLVVGDRFAREMVLTGRPVDAEEALDHGLVAAVHSAEELDDAVGRRPADCRQPAVGVALNKRGLNRAFPVRGHAGGRA